MPSTSYTNLILDNIPSSVFVVKVNDNGLFKIEHVNKAQLAFINKPREELVGKYITDVFPEELANRFLSYYKKCIKKGKRITYEEQVTLPDTGKRTYSTTLTPIENKKGEIDTLVGSSIDITEQKQSELSLRKSEEKFRNFIQNSSEGIYLFEFTKPIDTSLPYDIQIQQFFELGYLAACNVAMAEMYGYNDTSLIIGKNLEFFYGTVDNEQNIENFKNIIDSGYNIKDGLSIEVDKDGNTKYFLNNISGIVENGKLTRIWATQKDVTIEQEAEKEIQESLIEKNTLLSEIHHRVKNNLAVVSGMMQLQAFDTKNKSLQAKLFDSVARIQTMATVHELLYQSQSFANLEFSDTLTKLVENVSETLRTAPKIEVNVDCEPIQVNINQAIPASLIVNEVLTNAYKHAFPNTNNGILNFKLYEEDNRINIKITDNGIGFSSDTDLADSSSLGVHLIKVLSEQIEASYEYKNRADDNGACFHLSFKRAETNGL